MQERPDVVGEGSQPPPQTSNEQQREPEGRARIVDADPLEGLVAQPSGHDEGLRDDGGRSGARLHQGELAEQLSWGGMPEIQCASAHADLPFHDQVQVPVNGSFRDQHGSRRELEDLEGGGDDR